IGIVKNLFVTEPGPRVLDQVRRAAEADELVWVSEVDSATLRAQVDYHLAVADRLTTLPAEGSLAADRAPTGAGLAPLPATGRPAAVSPPCPTKGRSPPAGRWRARGAPPCRPPVTRRPRPRWTRRRWGRSSWRPRTPLTWTGPPRRRRMRCGTRSG